MKKICSLIFLLFVTVLGFKSYGDSFHKADLNQNWQIEASEVARVIELYNNNRYYKLDASQIDGYAPANNYSDRTTSNFHTSDSNGDGRICMNEVMHTIYLYNGGLFYKMLDGEFVPWDTNPDDNGTATFSLSSSAPSNDVLLINSNPYAGRSGWKYTNADPLDEAQFGQIFKPTTNWTVNAVAFQLSNLSDNVKYCDGDDFTLYIYQFSSASDYTPNSTVATFTGTVPTGADASDGAGYWLRFDFSNDVSLDANSYYGFFVEWNSVDVNRYISFEHGSNGSNTYNDGTCYTRTDGTWSNYNRDMDFAIIGTGDADDHLHLTDDNVQIKLEKSSNGSFSLIDLTNTNTNQTIFTFEEVNDGGYWAVVLYKLSNGSTVFLTPSDADTIVCDSNVSPYKTTWSDFGSYELTVTQEWYIRDDGGLVTNLQAIIDNDDYAVDEVRFPYFKYSVADLDKSEMKLILPSWNGQLIKNPLASVKTWKPYWPARTIMQFVASYAFNTGFMLMDEDPHGFGKEYNLISDTSKMEIYTERRPQNRHTANEDFVMNYNCVIYPIDGDWFDIAMRYRAWAVNQPWCSKGTLSNRSDIPTWYKDAPGTFMITTNDTTKPFLDLLDDTDDMKSRIHWPAGAKGPVFWYSWQHYNPEETAFCDGGNYDPDVLPSCNVHAGQFFPARQGSDFNTTMVGLANRDIYPVIFMNTRLYDQKNAEADDFYDAVVKNEDTSPALYSDSYPLWDICRYTDTWRTQYYNLSNQLLADHHAKGIYLDSMGGTSHACWDPSHGHGIGGGGTYQGDAMHGFCAEMWNLKNTYNDIIFIDEAGPDYLIDVRDGSLSWYNVYADFIPMQSAVYHDYWLVFGRTLTGGYINPTKYPLLFELNAAMLFNSGRQIGRIKIPDTDLLASGTYEDRATTYLGRLLQDKYDARQWMNYGQMLRRPVLDSNIPIVVVNDSGGKQYTHPAVLASAWRDVNGSVAVVITNWTNNDSLSGNLFLKMTEYFPNTNDTKCYVTQQGSGADPDYNELIPIVDNANLAFTIDSWHNIIFVLRPESSVPPSSNP